jgi:hypothetical protein
MFTGKLRLIRGHDRSLRFSESVGKVGKAHVGLIGIINGLGVAVKFCERWPNPNI